MRAGQNNTSVQRCPFLKKSPAYRQKQRSMFSVYWGSTNYRVLNGKRGQTAQAPRHLTSARVEQQDSASYMEFPRNRRVGQQDSASYMESPAIAV